MLRFWKIMGGLVAIIALSSCSTDAVGVRGVILPHHNLVSDYIDEFYAEISGDVDRIVLISTNHFELGYGAIQSTYDIDTSVDLDVDFIEELEEEGILSVEGVGFEAEHGMMVHIDRIEKFFPDVEVVPVILKWGIPEDHLDRLANSLMGDGSKSTLVIASIDFSHFVTEETALANDERTVEWLESWDGDEVSLEEVLALERSISMDTDTATALDSPETFYVFTQMIGVPGEVEVWGRTSSAANFGATDPLQNTSHLFAKIR